MSPEQRITRLEATLGQLIAEIERLPSHVLYRAPRPGEWSVMSTLAHLVELLPYWARQADNICRTPGAPFGRTHEDPDRIQAVEDHGHDTLEAMVPRLRDSLEQCVRILRTVPADAWGRAGSHSRRGSMTIEQVVDDFLVKHADEHAAQVQTTLHTLADEPVA